MTFFNNQIANWIVHYLSLVLIVYVFVKELVPLIIVIAKSVDILAMSKPGFFTYLLWVILLNTPIAFLEEFVYRVIPDRLVIQRNVLKLNKNIFKIIVFAFVGLIFALSHDGNIWVRMEFVITSILYSVLYDQTKSFLLIGTFHALHNILIDFIGFLTN